MINKKVISRLPKVLESLDANIFNWARTRQVAFFGHRSARFRNSAGKNDAHGPPARDELTGVRYDGLGQPKG
jgi:hypothetical protein